jgi:hypothetical protein
VKRATGYQHHVSRCVLETIRLFARHRPGLTTSLYGALMWSAKLGNPEPGDKFGQFQRLAHASAALDYACKLGYLRCYFVPKVLQPSATPPVKYFCLTGKGEEVYAFYERLRYTEIGQTAAADGFGRTRGGGERVRRARQRSRRTHDLVDFIRAAEAGGAGGGDRQREL